MMAKTKYKIVHLRDECIGCGSCAAVCPENWFMADDGKASPKATVLKQLGNNQIAAEACPVQIIKIVKEDDSESEK